MLPTDNELKMAFADIERDLKFLIKVNVGDENSETTAKILETTLKRLQRLRVRVLGETGDGDE